MSDPVMHSDSSPEQNSSGSSHSSFFGESRASFLFYTALAVGLALFIRFFIAAPYIVQGSSMEPTFFNFHYLIIDRVDYRFADPARGDVIVFDLPEGAGTRALIKRVIGLPNETVQIHDGIVTIFNDAHPEGFRLDEPYLDPARLGGIQNMTMALGKDQFFVLGDNRGVSSDSRIWGSLPRNEIVGRALVRLWPLTDIGLFPGKSTYQE